MLERFLKNSFNYWFFFILTAILCFGYGLAHPVMGIDDEILGDWSNIQSLIGINRWGLFFTRRIFIAYEYIPFVREFLFVLVYMLAINIYVKVFSEHLPKLFCEKATIIYSCIMLAFPYNIFLYCFMVINLECAFSFLLSAISVYVLYNCKFTNNIKKNLLLLLLLVFSLSFYELGIIYFLMTVCSISILKMILKEEKTNIFQNLRISFMLVLLSLFCNWSILAIIKNIVDFSRKERIYTLIKYDFSSIGSFIISLKENIANFVNNFLETCFYDTASQMILISAIIFFIIMIYYSIKIDKKIFILSLIFFLLPLSPFLLTGNFDFCYRVYCPYSILISISFVLLYNIFKNKNWVKITYQVIVCLVVILFIQEINKIFYTEYLKFQNDRLYAYSLRQEVLKLGDKPLMIIGIKENPNLNKQYYIEAPEINNSIFNWDRYDSIEAELFANRPYSFMGEQGYEVNSYLDEVEINNEQDYNDFVEYIKKLSQGMTIYPMSGSIKDCDDFILIKIGKSRLDS